MAYKADYIVIALIFGVILVLNLLATRAISRDDLSERGQRIAQMLMVWLFPLLGALLVLGVHRSPQKPSGQYRRPENEGDAYEAPGNLRRFTDVADD